jgi:hypothetical protein
MCSRRAAKKCEPLFVLPHALHSIHDLLLSNTHTHTCECCLLFNYSINTPSATNVPQFSNHLAGERANASPPRGLTLPPLDGLFFLDPPNICPTRCLPNALVIHPFNFSNKRIVPRRRRFVFFDYQLFGMEFQVQFSIEGTGHQAESPAVLFKVISRDTHV